MRTRRTSSSCGTVLGTWYMSAPPPCANTARIPDSMRAATAASAWSGVLTLCDQSSKVVMPLSSASTAPRRLPA